MQGDVTEARSESLSSDTESVFSDITGYSESVEPAAETTVIIKYRTLHMSKSANLLLERPGGTLKNPLLAKSKSVNLLSESVEPTALLEVVEPTTPLESVVPSAEITVITEQKLCFC